MTVPTHAVAGTIHNISWRVATDEHEWVFMHGGNCVGTSRELGVATSLCLLCTDVWRSVIPHKVPVILDTMRL